MAGIFGPTGREVFKNIQRDRARDAAARGAQAGSLSPQQMFGQAGAFLGLAANQGLEAATGQVPPEVARANKLQAAQRQVMRSGVSASDPVAFNEALAEALGAQGLLDEARETGAEAARLRQENEETANLQSLIAARMTVKQQQREDELAREARASEGKLDRESRERIATRRSAGSAPKARIFRNPTGSDRKSAEQSLRETFPSEGGLGLGAGIFDFGDLSSQNQDAMVEHVAARAKDLTTSNPGLHAQDAMEQAIEEARQGLTGLGATERAKWSPPKAPASDAQTKAHAILGL